MVVLNATSTKHESSFDINMQAALRVGDWKIIVGQADGRWIDPEEETHENSFGKYVI